VTAPPARSDRGELPRVDLDLENATLRNALKQVLSGRGMTMSVEADVPDDVHLTVRARGISLRTALDLISQSAGAAWRFEQNNGKTVVHVGRTLPTVTIAVDFQALAAPVDVAPGIKPAPEGTFSELLQNYGRALTPNGLLYQANGASERLTFTCPHCKGQTIMIRQQQQPKCPKCGRLFAADWQFCPADGTRRPSAPSEWRFCPLCGKAVEPTEKADTPTRGR
jgi:hypothetical protein